MSFLPLSQFVYILAAPWGGEMYNLFYIWDFSFLISRLCSNFLQHKPFKLTEDKPSVSHECTSYLRNSSGESYSWPFDRFCHQVCISSDKSERSCLPADNALRKRKKKLSMLYWWHLTSQDSWAVTVWKMMITLLF